MPPFAPLYTACAECKHRHTDTHRGGGGEGGREREPRHPYSQNENKCSFRKGTRQGFCLELRKLLLLPTLHGGVQLGLNKTFLATAHISYRDFTTGPLSP